jgi:FkbM family methyltransferase
MQQESLETFGQVLARATRPFPPWWSFRLYHHIHKLFLGDPYWCKQTPEGRTWAKVTPHDYEMDLSTADWMERYALHAGRFYSTESTAALQTFLDEGDCFIDVGANIGFMTLAAARIVGAAGHVFSFEPNTDLVERLREMIAHNQITNVMLFPYALGSESGQIGFTRDHHHGNNRILPHTEAAPATVQLRRADDVLQEHLPARGRAFVKLDVEGAELMVLKGMPSLVRRENTIFMMEICDEWLRRNGGSASEVFRVMDGAGYRAFLPSLSLVSSKLKLQPLNCETPATYRYDAIFRRPM